MQTPVTLKYAGHDYTWDGSRWYNTIDYTEPVRRIVYQLDQLLAEQFPDARKVAVATKAPPAGKSSGKARLVSDLDFTPPEGRPLRILVTGARTWNEAEPIRQELSRYPAGSIIIHCDAEGVDRIAGVTAAALGFELITCPADWKTFGRAASPLRNKTMLAEYQPDLVIAFHPAIDETSGTKNMVTVARKAGIPVRIISGHEA